MPGVPAVLTGADWQADGLGVLPVVHPVDFRNGRPMNPGMIEQFVYGDQTRPLPTAPFMDCGMPRASDLPGLAIDCRETRSPNNALGAKGGSEIGAIGLPAAIGNAIVDALRDLGVRRVETPYGPANPRAAIEHAPASGRT